MYVALQIFTHAVQLLAVIACLWYLIQKRSSQPFRFLAAGWMLILLHDLTMVVVGLLHPVKNHWVYNIAFPLQQLLILYFFALLLRQRRLVLMRLAFAAFVLYNLKWLQGPVTLNTYSLALGGLLILLLAAVKLLLLYQQDTVQSVFRDPVFWLCTGFLLYWAMATPFFALYNFLWERVPHFFTIYFYTTFFGFTVLLNLCIIKALRCSLRTATR